ncbi:MAG: undecaprenyl-diphosphate phosphatase [Candidatus Scalindua sp.]|jgi:undecaprenyl-diphosphatase|nr:undecaprenyl-diphosphate phosphatase [Candidatus Scalindua sp.]MBT5306585.1 undecaprenyl-diphosphate phosphatase [Candidatus Scalindua sp.]MBT6050063.1 undecaprenyl-diphosphate phosphatase [Candidatus Scalindua sp.]MBT6229902.1 undecaprenyl-diphosphate phosphatase [Candidatus Scalindua sp.]MBT6562043.1 undecaprenyl-diphosphate phosphatase [Candidatus Scalindua sp.]
MLIKSIILGLIQGLTEFLPISSSGHLVIFKSFLDMETQGVIWEIALHFSTLLAIFGVFYKDIFMILRNTFLSCKKIFSGESIISIFKNDPYTRIFLLIIIGTIPTVIIAFSFRNAFEGLFNKPGIAGYMLIVTGTMLWFTQYSLRTNSNKKILGVLDALIIGTVQGLAITPGISRSGTTIATATFRGVDRETAARFSFLLVIPVILGAMVMMAKDTITLKNEEISFLIIGSIVAAISGYISLRILIRIVNNGKLHLFSYYCWPVGLFVILYFI